MPRQRQVVTATVYDARGRKLSEGCNSYTKTHPLMARLGHATGKKDAIYLHAEVAALLKLRKWSGPLIMVVKRSTKDGKPAIARPCPLCQRALAGFGVRSVFYSEEEHQLR